MNDWLVRIMRKRAITPHRKYGQPDRLELIRRNFYFHRIWDVRHTFISAITQHSPTHTPYIVQINDYMRYILYSRRGRFVAILFDT